MQTSLFKKLTLVVIIAAAYSLTGCSDANSRNTTPSQNNAAPAEAVNASPDAAANSITNTPASEEAKRNAEAGNAIY